MKQLLLIIIFCIWGCQIRGSFKGLTSYRHEVEGQIESIISRDEFHCKLEYSMSSTLATLNGKILRQCVNQLNNSLVYLWNPNCFSGECLDLDLLQETCTKYSVTLFIVAEYYDFQKMNKKYQIENPIIGIDTYYYKTDFTRKYLKLFFNDLLDTNNFINKGSRYYYFKNGNFIKVSNELLDNAFL